MAGVETPPVPGGPLAFPARAPCVRLLWGVGGTSRTGLGAWAGGCTERGSATCLGVEESPAGHQGLSGESQAPHLGIVAAICTQGTSPRQGQGGAHQHQHCAKAFSHGFLSLSHAYQTVSLTLWCHQGTGGLYLAGQVSCGRGGAVVGMVGAQRWHSRDAGGGSMTGTEVGIAGTGWAWGWRGGDEVVVMARALGGHCGGDGPPRSQRDAGAVGYGCERGRGCALPAPGRPCVTLEGASVTGKGWAG